MECRKWYLDALHEILPELIASTLASVGTVSKHNGQIQNMVIQPNMLINNKTETCDHW